jgi:hypothetical protein
MVNNIQKFCSVNFNISINILKGKNNINNNQEYKIYNLCILLSWLLHPTQGYGCKSTIARLHNCKKNRVYRLYKLYNNNKQFKSFVDNAIKNYKVFYASA